MTGRLFHVFRNTPRGREIYLQSLYFCKLSGLSLQVYVPRDTRFLMYLEHGVVQVDLDKSYLEAPETAAEHVLTLAAEYEVRVDFFEPKDYTASTLPEVPINFDLMCSPRTIGNLSKKIGFGYLGPRVRLIIQNCSFPVLVPSPAFKEWKSLAVFFGGSANAINALRHALALQERTGIPIDLFTIVKGRRDRARLETLIEEEGLADRLNAGRRHWITHHEKDIDQCLYEVPHDALVIVGAYGHGLIKQLVFGSMMETIQSKLLTSLLIVGPHCHPPR